MPARKDISHLPPKEQAEIEAKRARDRKYQQTYLRKISESHEEHENFLEKRRASQRKYEKKKRLAAKNAQHHVSQGVVDALAGGAAEQPANEALAGVTSAGVAGAAVTSGATTAFDALVAVAAGRTPQMPPPDLAPLEPSDFLQSNGAGASRG